MYRARAALFFLKSGARLARGGYKSLNRARAWRGMGFKDFGGARVWRGMGFKDFGGARVWRGVGFKDFSGAPTGVAGPPR